jgi:hypothetical protein
MIRILTQASPLLLLLALLAAVLVPDSAHAIPAFTRSYKVECSTCHTIFPELNEYGDAFLKNSYVFVSKVKKAAKDTEQIPVPVVKTAPAPKPVAAPATTVGGSPAIQGAGDDELLRKLKKGAMTATETAEPAQPPAAEPTLSALETPQPAGERKSEGLLLSAIPEQLPISFTGALNIVYDNKAVNEFDFSTRAFKLHAGGHFRETVGFFATYVAYSEQPPASTGNTSVISTNNKTDLTEFFVSWRHLLDSPVNLKVGRMQPKLGLWKTNNKLSVTNNYLPYSYTVGGQSTGQQSVFRIDQTQDALELNSILAKRFFVAVGAVNRKGQNSKEGYGHFSYKFGGADYLANEPEIDLAKDESILDFLTINVGGYGYVGKNGSANSNDPKNSYYRVGLDSELLYKSLRLRLLGGYGDDDKVDTIAVNQWTRVISKSGTVEAEYALRSNLLAACRYEYLQQVASPQKQGFSDQYVRRYIATVGYNPYENLKLVAEYKYELVVSAINRLGTLGLTFGF